MPKRPRSQFRYYDDTAIPWLSIPFVAVPDLPTLERLGDRFGLPRPLWPPDVIDALLRAARC